MKVEHSVSFCSDEASWMVMIHGFGGTKKMWRHQIEEFKGSFNLIVLELPGHGDSEFGLCEQKGYSFGDVADDIVDMLHERGIEKADFLSLSLGSLVMAAIVANHRDVVNSVLMCGAVLGMNLPIRIVMRTGNLLKYIMPFMFTVNLFAHILLPRKSHKKSRSFLVSECKKLGRAEFLQWYSLLVREQTILKNSLPCFAGIKSLVVMGTEDYVFIKQTVDSITHSASKIALKMMNCCGHVCCLQNWRDFNVIAAKFFVPVVSEELLQITG